MLNNTINVLVLGDVVGRGGRNALIRNCSKIKETYNVDFLVVNGENASHGNGLTYKHYQELVKAGCDCVTMGNHVYGKKEIYSYAKKADKLVIPANLNNLDEVFSDNLVYQTVIKGKSIKVVNLLGIDNIKLDVKSAFVSFKEIYEQDPDSIYIVDYHAELTAEKASLGYYLDGKASIMFGTHTHIQTADERIMPQGMAYITDAGICGARESMIGFNYKEVLKAIWEGTRYSVETKGQMMLNGLLATIDLGSKKAIKIQRINIDVE